MPSRNTDLIATFNRIPLGRTPFVISFESHLPRLFGHEASAAFRHFSDRLCRDACRGIIPISDFARRTFLAQHAASPNFSELGAKLLDVVYPAVPVTQLAARDRSRKDPLKVIFVGSHFVRKGGLATLFAAREAFRQRLPIEFHVVSDLTIGRDRGVWTDPQDAKTLAEDLKLLKLPNIFHYGRLSNSELLKLLSTCDVSLLPTFSDTFGYSAIEAMAAGLPVIGTRCCALPEIVTEGHDGFLAAIETDEKDEWRHLWKFPAHDPTYLQLLRQTSLDVGMFVLDRLAKLEADRDELWLLGENAHRTALARFNAATQGCILDEIYQSAVARPR